jgi:hypothetical protein
MWSKSLSVALLATLALPAAAWAEQSPSSCSIRKDVVKQLADKYQESPVAIGLASNGGLVEVLTTGNGSTWTIIITMPNGMSCLVAAGEDWQAKLHIPPQDTQI